MVKLAQEIDESARESEYCDFHVKRVLTRYGGDHCRCHPTTLCIMVAGARRWRILGGSVVHVAPGEWIRKGG